MTVLAPTLLAAALALMPAPSPAWGEPREAFMARMGMITENVEKAVQKAPEGARYQLALAVVIVFWAESRFSPFVHSGEKRGDGGRAICMGQHHQLQRTEAEWLGLAGLDAEATFRCAQETARGLVRAYLYCADLIPKATYAEAFVLYGTGRTCRAEESSWQPLFEERAQKWRSLVYTCRKGPSTCLPWGRE